MGALFGEFSQAVDIRTPASVYEDAFILRAVWSATQDVLNNTSTITITTYLSCTDNWPMEFYIEEGYGTAEFRASQPWYLDSASFATSEVNEGVGSWTQALGTVVRTIPHDQQGNRTVNVHVSLPMDYIDTPEGPAFVTFSADGVLELPNISKLSIPSVDETAYYGINIPITWDPKVSTFKYKLKLVQGSNEINTQFISPGSTSQYTYNVVIPYSYLSSSIGSYASWSITLYAYDSNETLLGSKVIYIDVYVPDNSDTEPSIDSITLTPINGYQGYFVEDHSQARCVITASGKYGAIISSYSVLFSGAGVSETKTGSDVTSSIFNSVGITDPETVDISITVTDNRGISNIVTRSINVYEYSKPTLTDVTSRRWNESASTYDDNSTSMKVSFTKNFSSINNANSATVYLYYKKRDDENYTRYGTALESGDVISSLFSGNYTYDLIYKIEDGVGEETEFYDILSTSFSLINFRPKGLAFGKASESDSFECDLPAIFYKNVKAQYDANKYINLLDQFTGGDAISSGSNLNDYISLGVWCINSDYTAGNILNTPVAKAGVLIVNSPINSYDESLDNQYIVQNYHTLDGKSFRRIAGTGTSRTGFIFDSWHCISGIDSIIEYGTNDGWVYRKYYDGRFDCKKKTTFSNITIETSGRGLYYEDLNNISLPFSVNSVSNIQITSMDYGIFYCVNGVPSSGSSMFDIRICSVEAITTATSFDAFIFVEGE